MAGLMGVIGSAAAQGRALHQQARDFLAHHLGEGPADDPGSRGLHSNVYGTLGKVAMSNPMTFGVAPFGLLAGMENETVGGISEKLQGRPFFSDKGFDWQDLEANARGMAQGLREGSLGYNAQDQGRALRLTSR